LFSNLAFKRYNQIEAIRDLIMEKLPIENYNVLKYLIEFLNLVKTLFDCQIFSNVFIRWLFFFTFRYQSIRTRISCQQAIYQLFSDRISLGLTMFN